MKTLIIPTWFDTVERRSLLMSAARLWQDTPFFDNSCAPGPDGGVDCVNLQNAIYSTCAVIPRQTIPPQVMDAGQHSERSLLIEAFETWPDLRARFACVWCCERSPANIAAEDFAFILPGDSLCFRAGRVAHHGGLMLIAGEFIHAIRPTGVHRTQLAAAIRGRRILGELAAVYRPLP